mmetsp:Transcript_8421/g.17135  ORF Transcript_8421/g.17135 Transcript_8421/m.17135 type:complete len:91 (+) Transcript_8421:189-461(+)
MKTATTVEIKMQVLSIVASLQMRTDIPAEDNRTGVINVPRAGNGICPRDILSTKPLAWSGIEFKSDGASLHARSVMLTAAYMVIAQIVTS